MRCIILVVVLVCVWETSARSQVYRGNWPVPSNKQREDALWWLTRGDNTGVVNGNTDDRTRNHTTNGSNGSDNAIGGADNIKTTPSYTRIRDARNNRRNSWNNRRNDTNNRNEGRYNRNNARNSRNNGRYNRTNDRNSRNNGRYNMNNDRNSRNNGRYNMNNVRNSRNNGRYNRNNGRRNRNYGRNGGRTETTTVVRGNVRGYAVGQTRPFVRIGYNAARTTTSTATTTTTPPTTTTPIDLCARLAVEGSCDFYTYPQCLQAALNTCRRPQPLTVWAEHICRLSVLREPEFVGEGVEYIDTFRKCSAVNLLPYAGTVDCVNVNKSILQTVTRDQSQCLFQDGAFCRVIVDPQNCAALFHIFALDHAGELQFIIFDTFNFLITQCDQSAQDTFNNIFVNKFLDKLSTATTTTTTTTSTPMMMMGGNGRD